MADEEKKAGSLLRNMLVLIVLIVGLGVWVYFTGVYQLQPGQAAVILRLGEFNRMDSSPGLAAHLPYPIETSAIVSTQEVLQEQFGDVANAAQTKVETVMQTGDNAIVLLEFVVRYRKANPRLTLYRVADPEALVRDAAQAVMREVVARKEIEGILTGARSSVESEADEMLREVLASYETGIEVTEVELLEVQPPTEVRESFDDVVAANQDKNRQENEARAYENQVLPRAQATATELVESAEAYKQSRIAEAEGENAKFLSLLIEYQKAPEITRKRLYLETMEEVLSKSETIIVEPGSVVPYLPLDRSGKKISQ